MRNRLFLKWLLVALWMGFICIFSHQPATESSKLSMGLIERVVHFIQPDVSSSVFDSETLHLLIRKLAHFSIYLMLAIFVGDAVYSDNRIKRNHFYIVVGICFIYAISDEVHQLFIAGRSGEFRDVFIDTMGAIVGCALFKVVNDRLDLTYKAPDHMV